MPSPTDPRHAPSRPAQAVASSAAPLSHRLSRSQPAPSRRPFDRDTLVYRQSRLGYTWQPGPLRFQFYVNGNGAFDRQRQYGAIFTEIGPGLRFRSPFWPSAMFLSLDDLCGSYTLDLEDPRGPRYAALPLPAAHSTRAVAAAPSTALQPAGRIAPPTGVSHALRC